MATNDLDVNTIHTGDCLEVMADLPAESVHACVTDPPYGLAFMGNSWDDFEPKEYQEWCEQWAREVKRVLKPGGHMLSFSGTRTYHRLGVGVEDAGFEIRDKIDWLYGSGFPKALDVSKAIDKQADAEREVVNTKDVGPDMTGGNYENNDGDRAVQEITEPATDAAEQWDGFKTALKPAHEPVCVARKPFSQTVAENVQEHGTGALNIDGCRIDTDGRPDIDHGTESETRFTSSGDEGELPGSKHVGQTTEGRYPANVVFDEQAAEQLDRDVGELGESNGVRGLGNSDKYGSGDGYMNTMDNPKTGQNVGFGDTGGPSRYFYTSKATKAERTLDGQIENDHPTVKPTDLMEWLVKLVTAEGQIVLDPFAGSGTTCMAAKNLNREFIGIEQNERYADIARVRCGLTPNDPSVVRDDDGQEGLEAFE